jgi:putative ABC transport system permease protein
MAILTSTLPDAIADFLRFSTLDVDRRVSAFALAVAAGTTLVFALVPALQASRLALADALRGHGSAARRSSRLRGALVVSQVAVSLVLVIAALTLARNGAAAGSIDLGYHTEGLLSVNIRGEGATFSLSRPPKR